MAAGSTLRKLVNKAITIEEDLAKVEEETKDMKGATIYVAFNELGYRMDFLKLTN